MSENSKPTKLVITGNDCCKALGIISELINEVMASNDAEEMKLYKLALLKIDRQIIEKKHEEFLLKIMMQDDEKKKNKVLEMNLNQGQEDDEFAIIADRYVNSSRDIINDELNDVQENYLKESLEFYNHTTNIRCLRYVENLNNNAPKVVTTGDVPLISLSVYPYSQLLLATNALEFVKIKK